MPTIISGQVGPQQFSDGVKGGEARQGRSGEFIVQELHGKYYEQTLRGNVFVATGQATMAAVAASSQPVTIANPAGSGKTASLIRAEIGLVTAPGTQVVGFYGLYANTNIVAAAVTGTAATVVPALLGANYQPVSKVLTTTTLPVAPTLVRILETKFGALATGQVPNISIDFDGTLMLGAGTALTLALNVADTTSQAVVAFSFTWEEF